MTSSSTNTTTTTNLLIPRDEARTIRQAFAEHALKAAALAGIEVDPTVFRRNKDDNPLYSRWTSLRGKSAGSLLDSLLGERRVDLSFSDPLLGFERFAVELGPRPSKDHYVTTKDEDAGIAPGNLRWELRDSPPRRHAGVPVAVLERRRRLAAEACQRHGLDPAAFKRDPKNYLHRAFTNMRTRCNDPRGNAVAAYRERGITVHEDWDDDCYGFERFVAYVLSTLGPRPEGHSLDRIDNDRGYEPGNLRWATPEQQSRNTRRTKVREERMEEAASLVVSGATTTEIASHLGISRDYASTLARKLRKDNGLPLSPKKRPVATVQLGVEVMKRRVLGQPWSKVAAELGYSRWTLRDALGKLHGALAARASAKQGT